MHHLKKAYRPHCSYLFFFFLILINHSFSFFGITYAKETTKKITASSMTLHDGERTEGPLHTAEVVSVVNRQLLVHGKPFIMKAVCYNPVRKGETYPQGLMTVNPTKEDLEVIKHDFQMIQEAGINTLRTYTAITDAQVLALLAQYDLKVIVPVFSSFDTSLSDVKKVITTLKNHPSTLIWEVGNEWNYNFFYSKDLPSSDNTNLSSSSANTPIDLSPIIASSTNMPTGGLGLDRSIDFLKAAITYVRQEDTTHPVSTVIGDIPQHYDPFWEKMSNANIDLDLYGSNIYDWLGFNGRFERWATLTTTVPILNNKPLYISEFGATAFNATINNKDEAAQQYAVEALITEILNNISAKYPDKFLLGGAIFEWNDEWWKSSNSPNSHDTIGFYFIRNPDGSIKTRNYPQDLAADLKANKVDGPYPDHIFHEKWWGVVDIDRNKRAVYSVIQKLYKQ